MATDQDSATRYGRMSSGEIAAAVGKSCSGVIGAVSRLVWRGLQVSSGSCEARPGVAISPFAAGGARRGLLCSNDFGLPTRHQVCNQTAGSRARASGAWCDRAHEHHIRARALLARREPVCALALGLPMWKPVSWRRHPVGRREQRHAAPAAQCRWPPRAPRLSGGLPVTRQEL